MHNRRVLVLGATGRIGAILRKCWINGQGLWQSRAARDRSGDQSGGQSGGQSEEWAVFDPLRDRAALDRAAQGCTAVLCLSGVTHAAAARGADLADNTRLALAAVRAGAGARARVLLASSAAVYGNPRGNPETGPPVPLHEADRPAPLSDYGRAKLEMERAGAGLGAALGVPVTALRIGNIAGADAILGGWRPGFELDRFADGQTPRRSYIGPVTLARVLDRLAAAPALPPVLNLAAPGVVAMGALLDAAGLAWTPRPAPPAAIPWVGLSTAALEPLVPFDPAQAQPAGMVAEWRALETDLPPEARAR